MQHVDAFIKISSLYFVNLVHCVFLKNHVAKFHIASLLLLFFSYSSAFVFFHQKRCISFSPNLIHVFQDLSLSLSLSAKRDRIYSNCCSFFLSLTFVLFLFLFQPFLNKYAHVHVDSLIVSTGQMHLCCTQSISRQGQINRTICIFIKDHHSFLDGRVSCCEL